MLALDKNPQQAPVAHWLVAVQDPPIAQLVPLAQVELVTVGNMAVYIDDILKSF